jgi:hypothetical protein
MGEPSFLFPPGDLVDVAISGFAAIDRMRSGIVRRRE